MAILLVYPAVDPVTRICDVGGLGSARVSRVASGVPPEACVWRDAKHGTRDACACMFGPMNWDSREREVRAVAENGPNCSSEATALTTVELVAAVMLSCGGRQEARTADGRFGPEPGQAECAGGSDLVGEPRPLGSTWAISNS